MSTRETAQDPNTPGGIHAEIYESISEPAISLEPMSSDNENEPGRDMEFYEDFPSSDVSVPHKVVGGVQYAVVNMEKQSPDGKHERNEVNHAAQTGYQQQFNVLSSLQLLNLTIQFQMHLFRTKW